MLLLRRTVPSPQAIGIRSAETSAIVPPTGLLADLRIDAATATIRIGALIMAPLALWAAISRALQIA